MARLFKPRYRKTRVARDDDGKVLYRRVNGKDVTIREKVSDEDGNPVMQVSPKWYIEYVDAQGRVRKRSGFRDKIATQQLAAKIEKQVERQRAGIVDVELDNLERLLTGHLDDYLDDLKRAGRSEMYIYTISCRLKKVFKACRWQVVTHVQIRSFTGWLREQARQGKAPRTQNQYIDTLSSFMAWMVRQQRAENNPIAHVSKADTTIKHRKRRALSFEEIRRLLSVAEDRRVIYLTALLTGLRRSELSQLQWRDVHLDVAKPHIELRAETTKSHRADRLPLPPQLVTMLQELKPDRVWPTKTVFDAIPSVDVLRSDLRAAQIPYKDESGRQVDFHSLRKTFGTILAQTGVHIRTAMELMRHTDIRLTTQNYTDPRLLDTAAAANGLPLLCDGSETKEGRATGTDGKPDAGDFTRKLVVDTSCKPSGLAEILTSGDMNQSSRVTQDNKSNRSNIRHKSLKDDPVNPSRTSPVVARQQVGENRRKSWGTRIRT